VEQLHPFPADELKPILERFAKAEIAWVQDEPRNMGAWRFVQAQMMDHFPGRVVQYIGRPDSASPAVGSLKMHMQQQERILTDAIGAVKSDDKSKDAKAPAPAAAKS
jgi:2-oxoglutarate dehydrogenase E1 component